MIVANPSVTSCSLATGGFPHARLKTPQENGGKLIEPPVEAAGELAVANRRIIEGSDYDLQGRRLSLLAAQAREDLIAAALRHTRSYRDAVEPTAPLGSVFLAGHQPELFHPGVWLKNFVLGHLAQQNGGVAVNLVVDSDTIKSSSLRVPGGSIESPTVEGVLFDRPSGEIPFQARTIQDRSLFESFGRRAAERLAPLVPDPFVREYWPLVLDCSRRTNNLGECLAQSRHRWEAQWGLATLEIPQSTVCNLPAFGWLTAHLLAHLPRFWEIYNSALADYRRCYHVRSLAHPAPDLAADDDWLEAPFWIWTDDDPRRRRVFVRQRGAEILLSDQHGIEIALSLAAESEADRAVAQLATLGGRGIHLRSRALLTTLAARLVFGDIFLHGIGGAKYDRLTDAIIERFFGIEAPAYMVVSGTLHLPISRPRVNRDDLYSAERELRELTYHPERFLDPAAGDRAAGGSQATVSAREWIAQKRHSITAPFAPHQARERCRAIRSANEHLQSLVAPLRADALQRMEILTRQLRAEAVLSSRDYGFCLYPEKNLQDFLLAFPRATA